MLNMDWPLHQFYLLIIRLLYDNLFCSVGQGVYMLAKIWADHTSNLFHLVEHFSPMLHRP